MKKLTGNNSIAKLKECVILLHGLGRTKEVMNKIYKALEETDFDLINLSYNSITKDISSIADNLNELLISKKDEYQKFSFVTHSLGGIVLRRMLKKHPKHNIRKIVMIAPPNNGAALARILSGAVQLLGVIPYKPLQAITEKALSFTPPTVKELMDTKYLEKECAIPKCRFIIIAGEKDDKKKVPFDFIRKLCLGNTHNDGTVTVEETKLPGCENHIIVNESHTSILSNKEVIKEIVEYLREN